MHISVFAPNGTHPSICTPTFRHADSLDVLSPPRQQSTRDTRVCLPSLNIQLPTTRRLEKLLHNPCTKPISSCPTLFCVFKPTMYAAFGTTKAIQALSQNGNREESVLAKQSCFFFFFACFLLQRVYPGHFEPQEQTGNPLTFPTETQMREHIPITWKPTCCECPSSHYLIMFLKKHCAI